MYVTDLKSGTISGQTSRSQRRQTSLVRQLAERIILIHKLWQLGWSKKLFYRCRYRFDINQTLRWNPLQVLCGHTLAYNPFQTRQTDPVLILQQFSDCTNTPVSQMVDVIVISNLPLQMHIIINRSKNIFLCNMLRNQQVHIFADHRL